MIALVAGVASAYTTTLCADMNNNFPEARDGVGDRWYKPTTPVVPLRGAMFWVTTYDEWTNDVLENDTFYAGSNGCATFTTQANRDYSMAVVSESLVNGVNIYVGQIQDEQSTFWQWKTFDSPNGRYHPIQSATVTIRANFMSGWAAFAVAGQAMHLSNAGIAGAGCACDECGMLKIEDGSTSSGGGNGSYQEWIIADGTARDFLGHEIGHGVVRRRDGCTTPVDEWDAAGHHFCDATPDAGPPEVIQDGKFAPEWQSSSLKEGFADFYAAWLWNTNTGIGAQCWFPAKAEPYDLDHNGDEEISGEENLTPKLSCEGPPFTGLESYITYNDYLEDLVDHPNSATELCSISMSGVGIEYDVLRYLWDMYTDEGVSFGDLVDLYDMSDPHDWEGRVDYLHPEDMPYTRWRDAADAHVPDLLDEHLFQDGNGLDHGPF
jgi:hypothetical protein